MVSHAVDGFAKNVLLINYGSQEGSALKNEVNVYRNLNSEWIVALSPCEPEGGAGQILMKSADFIEIAKWLRARGVEHRSIFFLERDGDCLLEIDDLEVFLDASSTFDKAKFGESEFV